MKADIGKPRANNSGLFYMCKTCKFLKGNTCLNWVLAHLYSPTVGPELQRITVRCPGFKASVDASQNRAQ